MELFGSPESTQPNPKGLKIINTATSPWSPPHQNNFEKPTSNPLLSNAVNLVMCTRQRQLSKINYKTKQKINIPPS